MPALKRRIYCLAVLWMLNLPATRLYAQFNYTIKNFTNENGLSQNAITDMAMDYDGYLWIGTQVGLIRYDGNSFKSFHLNRTKAGTRDNSVWSIMNTPFDRQMLIKAKNGWLYKIERGQPQLLDSSLNESSATTQSGQYPTLAVGREFNYPQAIMSEKFNQVLSIHSVPLSENDFLVVENLGTSLQLHKGKQPPKYIPLPGRLRVLVQSQGHPLLVCGPGHFYLYDSLSFTLKPLKVPGSFKKALSDTTAGHFPNFYHGLYSGEAFMFDKTTMYILQFDAATATVNFIPQFTLPEHHRWTKVVYDSINSTFFLGTENEGIFQIKLEKIKTLDVNASLPQNIRINDYINYALLRINDTTVITPSGFRFTATDTGIGYKKEQYIYSTRQTIALAGDSAVICTVPNGGIYYYLKKEDYRIRHGYNDSFNVLMRKLDKEVSLLQPEGDSLWVSFLDYLYCITPSVIKNYTPYNNGTPRFEPIQLFYRLNKNEVLISNSKGLFNMKTSPRPVYEAVMGIKGAVRHISAYKNVLIASAYWNGLYILKDDKTYKVPLPEDMPELKECHSTYIDKQGYIWITTNRGLFKSTADAVVKAALAQGPAPYFFCYGRNDGIDNLEFNGGGVPAYAVLGNGSVFYPSMGGVVSFNPAELKDKVPAGQVYVERVSIDKKISNSYDSINLPADFSVLDIELSAVNFGDPRNLSVEYKLDNGQWEKISPEKELRITVLKISSGWHKLAIRKRTGFGDDDFVYTYLSIKRDKKIYEQWWFFPLVAILLAGLIWLMLRLYARHLIRKRKQLQELVDIQTEELSKAVEAKDMMIGIITHDMLTPLKHVSFIAAILEKGMEKDPQKVTEALKDIKQTSDKIHSGSQSIVNWMKYNNKNVAVNKQALDLHSFAESVLDVYRAIAKNKNVVLLNHVHESAVVEADHNIFTTIVTNIISNAVKYTSDGEIKIENGKDKTGRTILYVSDTGAGIDEATLAIIREVLKGNLRALKASSKVAPGLGYIIISELIRIHNLSVSIESTPGKGTTVSLFI